MRKYVFRVGYFEPTRRCSVRARTLDEAFNKCSTESDRRCMKRGSEPPVAWDMALLEVWEIEYTNPTFHRCTLQWKVYDVEKDKKYVEKS